MGRALFQEQKWAQRLSYASRVRSTIRALKIPDLLWIRGSHPSSFQFGGTMPVILSCTRGKRQQIVHRSPEGSYTQTTGASSEDWVSTRM